MRPVLYVYGRKWILKKGELFDDLVVDEMFLDDAFDDVGGGGSIPDSIGVDEENGSFDADAEAVGFGAEDTTRAIGCGLIQIEFDQSALEIIPGFESGFLTTANGFSWVGANENVALDLLEGKFFDALGEGGVWHGLRSTIGGQRMFPNLKAIAPLPHLISHLTSQWWRVMVRVLPRTFRIF